MNGMRRTLSSRWYNPAITIQCDCGLTLRWSRGGGAVIPVALSMPNMQTMTSSSRRVFAANERELSSFSPVSSYIVIGNGPIGASVTKHLIASLAANKAITADESNKRNVKGNEKHEIVVTVVDGNPMGMGSSHSDRARLIRTFDAEGDVDWTRWNRKSLRAFPDIERLWNDDNDNNHNKDGSSYDENKAGTRKSFFTRCGALMLGDEEFVARAKKAANDSLRSTASSSSSSFSLLSPAECQRKWPYLKPKSGCDAALFDPLGGIIDPRAFIEAQKHIALSLSSDTKVGRNCDDVTGGMIRLQIRSGVVAKIRNGGRTVELASGELLSASEKIVLCGGAYSGSLLEGSGIRSSSFETESLRASKRTVALLEVAPESVLRKTMPTIKYAFALSAQQNQQHQQVVGGGEQSRVEAGSVYILPPVWYPERGGKWFVKIGGGPNDFFEEGRATSKTELDDWLSSDGDPSSAKWLADIGKSLLSGVGVGFESMQSMACVTTTMTSTSETSDSNQNGVVMDDLFGDGRLVSISACQGKGAGPSDAIGADIVISLLQQG